jgi:hypothetical protein
MKIVLLRKRKILNLHIINRVVVVFGTLLLVIPSMELPATAQPSPLITLDRIFRYNSSPPGSSTQERTLLVSLKQWLGAYQRVLGEGNNYTAIFDRGSLPLAVEFKDTGDLKNLVVGCPITKALSVSEAPIEIQKLMSKCTRLKP